MKTTNHANFIAGKPVVNAKKTVTLHISPMDAKKGNVKDPGACAAARAAIRAVPNCIAARIHIGRAYLLGKDGKWMRYKTPESLRGEIIAFDRGGKFQPGDYTLRPMSPSDMGPHRVKNFTSSNVNRSGKKDAPTKSPRKFHVVKGVRQHGANR